MGSLLVKTAESLSTSVLMRQATGAWLPTVSLITVSLIVGRLRPQPHISCSSTQASPTQLRGRRTPRCSSREEAILGGRTVGWLNF